MVRVIARNKVSFGTAAEILAKTKFVGGYYCDIYSIHIYNFPLLLWIYFKIDRG